MYMQYHVLNFLSSDFMKKFNAAVRHQMGILIVSLWMLTSVMYVIMTKII